MNLLKNICHSTGLRTDTHTGLWTQKRIRCSFSSSHGIQAVGLQPAQFPRKRKQRAKPQPGHGNRKRNYWNNFREMVIAKRAMLYSSRLLSEGITVCRIQLIRMYFVLSYSSMYQQRSDITSSILFCNVKPKTKQRCK